MDQNEVTKKLEVYQEAFKLFNGIQDNAAELLMECQMNYTVFLDNHPEFKPCFAYAGATMFVGLYQLFWSALVMLPRLTGKQQRSVRLCAGSLRSAGS